ncbi:hypothetical protein JCM3766R1_006083 [Sporobolomyces carnicolor]
MTSSSSDAASSLAALKTISARPSPLDLSQDDVKLLVLHVDGPHEAHSLVLAILARSTSSRSPSRSTRAAIEAILVEHLSGTDSTELVRGLSFLSALVQVSPSFVASDLLSDAHATLVLALRDAIEHISSPVKVIDEGKGKERQSQEEVALVELLSLASGQPGLRQLVANSTGEWLETVLDRQESRTSLVRALAGVGVVKLRMGKHAASSATTGIPRPADKDRPSKWSLKDLANLFVDLAVDRSEGDNDKTLQACLEGLAYLTLTSSRELKRIASQPHLLAVILSDDKASPSPAAAARDFAIATLLDHLTRFPTLEDAESDAAQVERLKKFASAGGGGKTVEREERETVEEVTARVSLLARHSPSPIPVLRRFCLSPSLQTRRLAGSILHSFVTPQPLRGTLLQAGVARLLLSLIRNIPAPFDVTLDLAPVQGLAKLLITANPLLVFGPTPSSPLLLEATTALTLPLNSIASSPPPPLLATFESLMALTNVASLDPEFTDKLARLELRDQRGQSFLNAVEQLLLNSNTMVRRAATELICNLVASEPGIAYFEPSSPSSPSASRVHVLLALSSAEDVSTRLAASGALTSLVYSRSISTTLVTNDKFIDLLLGLLDDDEPGVRHRGYEAWRGIGEVLGSIEAGPERGRVVEALTAKGVARELDRAKGGEKKVELKESIGGASKVIAALVDAKA